MVPPLDDPMAEKLSGNGFLSKFNTSDLRNLFLMLGFIITGVTAWVSLSATVSRINDNQRDTTARLEKITDKILAMDSSGTIALRAHIAETRTSTAKLDTLDARTIELLVKIQGLESSLNELKGFAGLKK